MERRSALLVFFISVFLISIFMIIAEDLQITGYDTSGTTVSNVTITSYLSITMSTNLSEGVLFGSVAALPARNVSATHNYDGGTSASTMLINVSTDSNTPVDFCLKANANMMTSGGDFITLANETYSNSTLSNDALIPALANNVSLTTSYVKAGAGVGLGNSSYYRFWLSIPVAQATGTYNNTILFEGKAAGTACS